MLNEYLNLVLCDYPFYNFYDNNNLVPIASACDFNSKQEITELGKHSDSITWTKNKL